MFSGLVPLVLRCERRTGAAGATGTDGEVGIEGQDHHLFNTVGLDVCDGGFREGMPVAHGHIAGGIHAPTAQFALQFAGLLFRNPPQGGAAADRAIGLLGLTAPQGADQPGQGFLQGRVG